MVRLFHQFHHRTIGDDQRIVGQGNARNPPRSPGSFGARQAVDGGLKRIYLDRGIDYVLADTKAIAHDKHSIDGMMMTMMVQAFKLARQKSESDERDDQISAQNWAQLLKQYAQYFNNATKGKGNLSVEKLLIELQTESPPQGVDSLD